MLRQGKWVKSQASGSQDCMWAMLDGEWVHVRDEDGNMVRFTKYEWAVAMAGAKAGDFDLPE